MNSQNAGTADDIMSFKYSAEIFAGYIYFNSGITSSLINSVWLESYCWSLPNVTAQNCSYGISQEIKNEVQPQLSRDFFINNCIKTLLPAIAVIFIGPCTDIFGKRPILLTSIFGYFLSYLLWFLFSFNFKYWNPLLFLLPAVPIGLTGGSATFFVVIFCFILDSEEPLKLIYRFARLQASCQLGLVISQVFVKEMHLVEHGYLITFFLSAFISLLLLVGIYVFIPPELPIRRMELIVRISRQNQEVEQNQDINQIQEIPDDQLKINWVHELNVFKPVFKSRPEKMRGFLLFIVMTVITYLIVSNGDHSILYESIKHRFAWTFKEFFFFNTLEYFTAGVMVLVGSWIIMHILKFQDPTALMIATIPQIIASVVYAFSIRADLLYVGMSLSCISTLVIPISMSIVAQMIPRNEFARVISFIMSVSSLAAIGGNIIYTSIYGKLILDYVPGPVFLVSCSFSVLCTIFAIGVCLANYGPYQNLLIISPPREATSPL